MRLPPRNGFTLIELSIVVTVIALLVGGVLVGRDMIRASQVQSVVADSTKYIDAMNQFRDKYLALPGDYSLATTMWGAANGNAVTCQTTSTGTAATCNGDGDGRIGLNSSLSTATQYERYRAWQQLVNAGLLSGKFSGVPGPAGAADDVIDTNVPSSKLSSAGWSITSLLYNEVTSAPSDHYFPAQYQHVLLFGADTTSTTGTDPDWNFSLTAGALVPGEALAIDQKIDDAKPGSGKLMAPKTSSVASHGCSTTSDPATAEYDIPETALTCSLIFLTGF